ncbi:hypothetical protein FACS1894211_16640 [Clostridia bacterium]|nr:hypothetical protein FACS1894211_16640 [Clostridia bacterium]
MLGRSEKRALGEEFNQAKPWPVAHKAWAVVFLLFVVAYLTVGIVRIIDLAKDEQNLTLQIVHLAFSFVAFICFL